MTLRIILIVLAGTLAFNACKPKPTAKQAASANFITNPGIDTTHFPKPIGYVSDYTHLYTPEQARTLNSLLTAYEKKTSIEIALVTLDSSMVGNQNFDEYTMDMAQNWGVGKKETNNGVFIAIAPNFKRMRINTGLRTHIVLSDEEIKAIIDGIFVPSFRSGRFYEGTLRGIEEIMKKLS